MAEFQFNFFISYSFTFITDDHDLNPPRVPGMDQIFFQTFFKTEVLVRKVSQFGLTAESGAPAAQFTESYHCKIGDSVQYVSQ